MNGWMISQWKNKLINRWMNEFITEGMNEWMNDQSMKEKINQ